MKQTLFASTVVFPAACAVFLNCITVYSAFWLFVWSGFFLLLVDRSLRRTEQIAVGMTVTYFLIQLIGNYMTLAPQFSLAETLRIAGMPAAVFILVLAAARNNRAYLVMVAAFVAGVVVVDVNVIFNAVNGIGRTGAIFVLELKNFFQWPDWLNAICCPFAAVMAIKLGHGKLKLLWFVLFVITFAASLLNGGRMLWLALLLCALVYLKMSNKLTLRNILLGLAATLVFGLILYIIPTTRWRILMFFDLNAMANADRIMVWKNSWVLISDFSWFGVGNGMFKFVFNKYYTFGYVFRSGELSHAHNLLLARLADTGIVGTVPYIAMLWYYFKSVYARLTVAPEVFAGYLAMCGWLFMGIFDYCLRFPPTSLAFAIIAALTIARANMADS